MARQRIQTPVQWLARLRHEDRNAADAFEALFRALVGRDGSGLGIGDRLEDQDIGTRDANGVFQADRRVVWEGASGGSITNDPTTVTTEWRHGGFMHVVGNLFGADNDLIEWYGPDLADVGECSKDNGVAYRYLEVGPPNRIVTVEQSSGDINWSDQLEDADAGETVSVTHSNDGTLTGTTNGNTITVSMSYKLRRSGTATFGSVSAGSISADLILTRDYDGGGAVSVATPTATGSRTVTFIPPALIEWTESITWSDTYQDTTGDTQDRVFILELDAFTGLAAGGTTVVSTLTIASQEPA